MDDSGYDLVKVPAGSSLAHDGMRVRVHTSRSMRMAVLKDSGGRVRSKDSGKGSRVRLLQGSAI